MKGMKREYEVPGIQMIVMEAEDVICASGGLGLQGEAGENNEIVDAGNLGL